MSRYAVAVKATLETTEQRELFRLLLADDPDPYVIVHDTEANTDSGVRLLMEWLYTNDVPFNEIWQGFGKPEADVYVDGRSVKL
jgi:hypothetical protein